MVPAPRILKIILMQGSFSFGTCSQESEKVESIEYSSDSHILNRAAIEYQLCQVFIAEVSNRIKDNKGSENKKNSAASMFLVLLVLQNVYIYCCS